MCGDASAEDLLSHCILVFSYFVNNLASFCSIKLHWQSGGLDLNKTKIDSKVNESICLQCTWQKPNLPGSKMLKGLSLGRTLVFADLWIRALYIVSGFVKAAGVTVSRTLQTHTNSVQNEVCKQALQAHKI